MSNLRADVRDLYKWGNRPLEIAKILGVHVDQVTSILIGLGLVKPPASKARKPTAGLPRERFYDLRKLDAEIAFYETRVASLKQHRVALSSLEQSADTLQQTIDRASR